MLDKMFGQVDKMKPVTMGSRHDSESDDAPVTREEFEALKARVAALEGNEGEAEDAMPMKPMMGKPMMK